MPGSSSCTFSNAALSAASHDSTIRRSRPPHRTPCPKRRSLTKTNARPFEICNTSKRHSKTLLLETVCCCCCTALQGESNLFIEKTKTKSPRRKQINTWQHKQGTRQTVHHTYSASHIQCTTHTVHHTPNIVWLNEIPESMASLTGKGLQSTGTI